jgi:hypothetical protein
MLAGIDGQHDGHQAAHDMGVRIAVEGHQRIGTLGARMAHQPDLAGTALHLVFPRLFRIGEIGQLLAQFDHIAVAVFPFFEEGKIIQDLLKVRHARSAVVPAGYRDSRRQ